MRMPWWEDWPYHVDSGIDPANTPKRREISRWLMENSGEPEKDWTYFIKGALARNLVIVFKDEKKAAIFKLWWC